jgi:phenylacetate-CoA ligase
MSVSLIKKIHQHMPNSLARVAAPVIHRRLIDNKTFQWQYNQLIQYDTASADEIEAKQLEILRSFLITAGKKVPYYRALFIESGFNPWEMRDKGDLGVLPLLTKETVRDRRQELLNPDFSDSYSATTGGSSGKSLVIDLARESIYRERAFIYHYWSKFGFDYRTDRLATFRGAPSGNRHYRWNPLYNEVLLTPLLLNSKTVEMYSETIESFHADYLQGYPSAIAQYCLLAKTSGIRAPKTVRAIFLVSENLLDEQKRVILDYFDTPISMYYGHTERSVFAELKPGQSNVYRFNPLYGFTELIDNPDGNIVCTGFLNPRMPLVRYATDDTATPLPGGTEFAITGHRNGKAIVGRGGEALTQTSFEGIHSAILARIDGYQIIQERRGTAEFCFMSRFSATENDVKEISSELTRIFPSVRWTARQVDSFSLSDRGKFQPIISFLTHQ